MTHAVAVRKANEVSTETLSEAAEQYRGSKAAATMKAYGGLERLCRLVRRTGHRLPSGDTSGRCRLPHAPCYREGLQGGHPAASDQRH